MGRILPADRPGPGGLNGRGALGEPGRSRRCAPRARESDALPVTQAAREPAAPSARSRDNAARGDRRTQSEDRGSNDGSPSRLSSVREISDFPLAVRTRRVLTTVPDDVRQAARIRRILAPSRESSALSNDSESQPSRAQPLPAPPGGGFSASIAYLNTAPAAKAHLLFRSASDSR